MRTVLTRASAAIDRSVVRFMERRMAPKGRPPRIVTEGDARARLIEVAKHYRDGTLGHPSPFFPEPVLPTVRQTHLGEGPLGTQVVSV